MQLIKLDNYIEKINNSNLDTFPRTLMLIGKFGSGKHSLCELISSHLRLSIIDLTDNIELEVLEEIQLSSEPHIYIIDGDKITLKEEAMLLKSIEEPSKNCFFIILSSTGNVIQTISNRCIKWELPTYTLKDLSLFTDNELVLKIATTPGEVKSLIENNVNDLFILATKIIDKLNVANYSNTLSITNKIDTTNDIFLKVLANSLINKINCSTEKKYQTMYDIVSNALTDFNIKNIDKKLLIESCLTDLWYASRGE